MKILLKISFKIISSISILFGLGFAHQALQPSGFTYSGELFQDPDWGPGYKTTESDRIQFKNLQVAIDQAMRTLIQSPGDYSSTRNDMRFLYDSIAQEESRAAGNSCGTCVFSVSPVHGEYLQYQYELKLDLLEGSATQAKDVIIREKLKSNVLNESERLKVNSNADQNNTAIQSEMEALQKQIEKLTADGNMPDDKMLAEIEAKSRAIASRAEKNEALQSINEDTLHNWFGAAYANVIRIDIHTNDPLSGIEINSLKDLTEDPGFVYKPLTIPGCDFACIYFDGHNISDDLTYSDTPFFLAYIGKIYTSSSELPKEWVKPFCLRISFSGNEEQINQIIKKIDFTKLKSGIQ